VQQSSLLSGYHCDHFGLALEQFHDAAIYSAKWAGMNYESYVKRPRCARTFRYNSVNYMETEENRGKLHVTD
jgi:hypothetical protein